MPRRADDDFISCFCYSYVHICREATALFFSAIYGMSRTAGGVWVLESTATDGRLGRW